MDWPAWKRAEIGVTGIGHGNRHGNRGQSFLQLGDLTLASALLAMVTAALPLAMRVGLGLYFRRRPAGAVAVLDGLAMLAVVQWALVLAAWELVPLRLWA